MKKREFNTLLPDICQYDHRLNPEERLVFPSLQALLSFVEQYDTSSCFFRGQAGLWPLVSTMYRHWNTPNFEKAQKTATAAVSFLIKNSFISNVVKGNTNHALAIAQHYGCPTDLVDVTTDIRVAAYFASSGNQDHVQNPEGCIWVFTQHDLNQLKEILRIFHDDVLSSISPGNLDMLKQNDWSLLYQIDIPELSRLNAQSGSFLWDMGGSLDQLVNHVMEIGIRLVFKHTENEQDTLRDEAAELFPHPNQLESEIMRIFTESSRENGLPQYPGIIQQAINESMGVTKNGLDVEIVNAFGSEAVTLPLPDLFRPSFGPYPWIKRQVHDTEYKAKNINMEKCVHCYLQFDPDPILQVVEHILDSYRNECMTDYYIACFSKDPPEILSISDALPVMEMVINLSNYEYTSAEIAQVLFEYFRLECFKQRIGFTPANDEERVLALITGKADGLLEEYYGCRVTKLNLHDNHTHVSFWLPETYQFLDQAYQDEFAGFDKSVRKKHDLFEDTFAQIPDNAQIFLYQHYPSQLMSYEKMKELFIRLFLPQMMAFRPSTEKIYIPDHITGIALPYFGRALYISKS